MMRIRAYLVVLSFLVFGVWGQQVSAQCNTWEIHNPQSLAIRAAKVDFLRSTWVVLYENGLIQTSPNGAAPWRQYQLMGDPVTYGAEGARASGIAANAAVMVVVTENGDLITTPDLLNWSLVETGGPAWAEVTWTGSYFAAVGARGAVFTSPDGLEWTQKTAPAGEDLSDIAWFDGKLITLGNRKLYTSSDDGDSWSERALSVTLNGLTTDGKHTIIGVGNGGSVFSSLDGVQWTITANPRAEDLRDVIWHNGAFKTFSDAKRLYLINDQGETSPLQAALNADGQKVVDPFKQIYDGTDGLSRVWMETFGAESGPPLTTASWSAFAASPDLIVAAGQSSLLGISRDGETWESVDLGGSRNIQDLYYYDGKFIGVDLSGTFISSTDGENWEDITVAGATAVAGSAQGWVAASSGAIQFSGSGRNWYSVSQDDANVYRDILWDNFRFIAVGSGGAVKTSEKGVIWTMQTSNTTDDLRAITDNGAANQVDKVYVAVGVNRTILRSTDAQTWTQVQRITGETLETVVWTGSHFFAMGSNFYYTSPDGSTWTSHAAPLSVENTFATHYTGFRILAGGDGGAIYGQDCDGCDVVTLTDEPLDVRTAVGGDVFLTVKATGSAPLSYQWYRSDGEAITGAVSDYISVTNVNTSSYRNYYCVVSNACSSVSTRDALFGDLTQPTIYSLTADGEVCNGDDLVMTVLAGGVPPLSYQWSLDGVDISGATSSSLAVSAVTSDGLYRCRVTDGNGQGATQSLDFERQADVIVRTETPDKFACVGSDTNLTADIINMPNYQWYFEDEPIAGATTGFLDLSNIQANQFGTYKCLGYSICGMVFTQDIELSQDPTTPTINSSPPATANYCPGDNAVLTVDASSLSTISYQWYKDNVEISGASSASLFLNNLDAGDAASYTCTLSNSCAVLATTDPAEIVIVEPVATLMQNSFCEGDDLTLSVTIPGNAPSAYQWRLDGVDISGATSATLNLNPVAQSDVGDYTCAVTGDCGVQVSNTLEVRMDETISINSQPSGTTVCEGDAVNLSVGATGNSLNYQWRLDGVDISGATSSTLSFNAAVADAGTFTCRVYNGCVSQISTGATLAVNTAPAVTTQPSGTTLCSGGSTTFSVTATGTAPLSYQWRKDGVNISGATSSSFSVTNAVVGNAGFYDCVVTNTCTSVVSNSASLTVIQTPAFTSHPSGSTVCVGDAVNLAVTATGTALSYQWRKDGVNISGATAATYAFTAAAGNSGSYTCVITNTCGSQTSNGATLVVNQPIAFTQEPSSTSVCDGAAATFNVVASGTGPFTYQWRKDGGNISGATSAQYNIASAAVADDGAYDCVVTNPCGSMTTSAATLTVTPAPSITTGPSGATVCVGDAVNLSVIATGSALTYQWKLDGTDISGATSSTLALTAATADAGSYTCVVTNGCGSQTSSAATVTVNEPVALTAQPQNVSACPGSPFSFSVTATGTAPLTYQWRKDGVDISGATSATYSVLSAAEADEAAYTCVVTNTCGAQTTDAATLSVDESVNISGNPSGATVCVGDAVNLSVTASGGSLSYQWRKDGMDISGATSSTYGFTATSDDTGSYTCVVTNGCGSLTSSAAAVTVNSPVSFSAHPQSTGICSGSNLTLTVTAGGTAPLTYQWRKDGSNISGATSASYAVTGAVSGDAGSYDCVVTNTCGSQTSNAAVITVQTVIAITASPSNADVCVGDAVNLSVTATGDSPTYQWRKDGVDVSGATASTYSFTAATDNGGSYTCVVGNSCGSETSSAGTVTVNSPVAFSAQPQSTSVCTGGSTTFSVTVSGTAPITYQWRKDGVNISGATDTHYTIGSVATGDAATYDCVVTNTCGSLTSLGAGLSVDESVAVTGQPAAATLCVGDTLTLTVTATGDSLTYQWRLDGVDISGATSATYTKTAASADAGSYLCVVTNSCGAENSQAAAITVNEPVAITAQPQAASACTGTSTTFSVTATGTGTLSYQWRKDGVDISGATAATLSLSNIQSSDAAAYRCVIENVCGSLTSDAVNLTVDEAVSITTSPSDTTTCIGDSVTLTVVAGGDTPGYQWRKDGVDISGATAASYTFTAAAIDAGAYTCVVSNSCGSQTSESATLTVNTPIAFTTQPQSTSACTGTSTTFSVSASGTDPITYQWRKDGVDISGATGADYTIADVATGDAATYTCVVTNPCGSQTSTGAVLSVDESIAVTGHPADATLCAGDTLTVTVIATGDNPTYQWRLNSVEISGATSATYTKTAATEDAGAYTCIVTNGCGSLSSQVANITVNAPVAITAQPQNTSACTGTTATLSVTATGTATLAYQWRKAGVDIAGATAATLTLSNVQTSDEASYDCVITNVCGAATTDAVTLTVDEAVAVTAQPTGVTTCAGESVTLTVAATGDSLSYQWRKDGVDVSGATAASYTFTAAVADAGDYTCVVTNSCGSLTSNNAALVVNEPVAVTSQPQAQSACTGTSTTFSVTATGTTPLTYQWRKGGVDIAGAVAATYTINSVVMGDAGSYDCLIQNTCGSVTTNAAVLTVDEAVSISGNPSDTTVCTGVTLNLSVTATGESLAYQWRKDGADIAGATAATYSKTAQVEDAGVYTCVVSNSCGSQTSGAATVTVNQSVAITAQPQAASACTGTSTTFSVTAEGTATLTYQWRKDGVNISGATAASLTLSNIQSGDGASYDCVVQNSCGAVTSNAVTLTVDEAVAITSQPGSTTTCVDEVVKLQVTATGDGLSYQWRKDGVDVSGATSASYSLTAAVADAGDYTCVVTNSCGSLTSSTATLTVNEPVTISAQPQAASACTGTSASFSVTASGTGTLTYQWRKDGADIAGATAATYTINPVATGDAANYDCVIQNTCGSTATSAVALTVDESVAITTQPLAATACTDESVTFTVAATGGDLTYQWRKDGVDIAGATAATYTFEAQSSGSYICVVTNSCGSQTSEAAALTVNQAVEVTLNSAQTALCSGDTLSLSVTATGAEPLTYQWRKDDVDVSGATAATFEIASVVSGDSGAYTCVVTNLCGSRTSTAANVTVDQTVQVDTQPTSQAVCVGDTATFTVVAAGDGLSYQWRKDGLDIVGATQATFSFTAGDQDEGQYVCVISNACAQVTSDAVTLTVDDPIAITSQPQASDACIGDNVTVGVTATGAGPITYQWRKNGTDIAGATDDQLTFASVSFGDNGAYDCIITNHCGSETSNAVNVSVEDEVQIQSQSSDILACELDVIEMSVVATGTNLNYQWAKNGQDIPGATNDTLTFTGVGFDSGDFTCRVFNDCDEKTTEAIVLQVDEPATITSQPQSSTACPEDGVTFSVTATGTGPLSYQWRKNGVDISGATASTYTVPAPAISDEGDYSCFVSNDCGDDVSNEAALVVDGPLEVRISPTLIAQGNNPVTLTAGFSCAVGQVTNVWTNADTGEILGTNVNSIQVDMLTESTVIEIIAGDESALESTAAYATILVSPNPNYQDQNGDGCNTIEDLYVVASEWLTQDVLDADGNGVINIFDLLYVNTEQTQEECNQPRTRSTKR